MPLAKYVKFREEKFGGVLFETRSEKVFTLNAAATAVVREIKPGSTMSEIVAKPKGAIRGSRLGRSSAKSRAFIAEPAEQGLVQD